MLNSIVEICTSKASAIIGDNLSLVAQTGQNFVITPQLQCEKLHWRYRRLRSTWNVHRLRLKTSFPTGAQQNLNVIVPRPSRPLPGLKGVNSGECLLLLTFLTPLYSVLNIN